MADLAYTDTAEPRRPSLRVAVGRERYQVLAFVGIAGLVVGFAAAGGGYFPTAVCSVVVVVCRSRGRGVVG